MNSGKQTYKKTEHPKARHNFFGHWLFCWQLPVFFKNKDYKESGNAETKVYETLEEHKASILANKLQTIWSAKKKRSLTRALIKLFGPKFFLYAFGSAVIDTVIVLVQPLCVKRYIEYFANEGAMSLSDAYLYAGGILFMNVLRVLSFHNINFEMISLGQKVNIACSSLIYGKCLKLRKHQLEDFSTGKLVNLLSNDVNRFIDMFVFLRMLITAPLQLLVSVYYIQTLFGSAGLIGIGIIVILFVVQIFTSRQLSFARMRVAKRTDGRINLMNDVINGIRIVKMYTWEKSFAASVEEARNAELKEIATSNCLRLTNSTFKIYTAQISLFLYVLVTLLTDNKLTSELFFPLSTLYRSLNASVIIGLQMALIYAFEARTSIERIEEFLLYDIHEEEENHQRHNKEVRMEKITVQLGNCKIFDRANFKACSEELVMVVGPAGCGKSTLLHLILKEIPIIGGFVRVGGTLSYASQEAWIFSDSIKQNILFGEEMCAEKYCQVVKVCALESDFLLFPHGDETLVGDRGVMLSGGQKARINLARAVYRNADMYLLDDPLSAVDPNVAKQIFNECIKTYLAKKTVILVTHQIQFINQASRVYSIADGRLVEESIDHFDNLKLEDATIPDMKLPQEFENPNRHQEAVNSMDDNLYIKYFFSGSGHWMVPLAVLSIVAFGQLLGSVFDILIATWLETPYVSKETFLSLYGGLLFIFVAMAHARCSIFSSYCVKISKKLHKRLLDTVLHLPVQFFNDNSAGRVLNRFSQDLGFIDERVPWMLYEVLIVVFDVFAAVLILISVNYWFIIVAIILLALTALWGRIFKPLNQYLRQLEAITNSPILSHVVATLQGLMTIRTFKNEEAVVKEFESHQDLHSSVYYLMKAIAYTLLFLTDFNCIVFSAVVTFSFLLFDFGMSSARIGLAVTLATYLLGLVQAGMRSWSELDNIITMVGRVLEYSQLPREENNGISKPDKGWPYSGKIEFQSVCLRYHSNKPYVLKNITFVLQPGEKLGIVGRTGAGKSSMISLLFRLFDFEGNIIIDGIITKHIRLKYLRSKISVIPQDPVLFIGSLRKNLDPFDEFSDFEIYEALEATQMKRIVSQLNLGLQSMVSEGGVNFSVGEKQLLCLTRAMLKNNKVVIFDEATANVDLETDKLIQSTIRKRFRYSTVLTIAHRINTVMDSDKILVLDAGEVIEFGKPEELMENEDGAFYKLQCKQDAT